MKKISLLRNPLSSTSLALLVMFFWGSLFPMIKIGYNAFGVDTSNVASILLFAGLRFLLCGAVLITVSGARMKRLEFPARSALTPILLIALTAYVLHYACTYIGISHLESSKTAIIKQTGTLFIICFAFLFRKEDRFTPAKLIGGLLGFSSILVVNLNGLHLSVSGYDLLILLASFCSAAGMIFSKNAYDSCDPLYITAWAQLFGGVILLTLGLLLGGRLARFDLRAVLVLVYMCYASCAGYGLWNLLLKYNDMSRLNVIKFAETLFSALCSWALLGENVFRLSYLFSFLLVCAGILFCNLSTVKKKVST